MVDILQDDEALLQDFSQKFFAVAEILPSLKMADFVNSYFSFSRLHCYYYRLFVVEMPDYCELNASMAL